MDFFLIIGDPKVSWKFTWLGCLQTWVLIIIRLDKGGVLGDKFYQKNIDRSVLISTIESYELARAKGIEVSFGSLGENILMDFNPI